MAELRRLLIDAKRLSTNLGMDGCIALNSDETHYLKRVLRLRQGAIVGIVDGVGHLWESQLRKDNSLPSLMHNLAQLEYQGEWARCWVDLGTCDALAIDVLINALLQIHTDFVQIEELLIGGVNEDWTVEDHPDAIFSSNE